MKTQTPARKRARPGGRSARIVAAVLRATLEVLGRSGYARLRIEDVAAAAKVNKTTIYRRWPSRAELVGDAVARLSVHPIVVWSGRVERDLVAVLLAATALWSTPIGRGIARVLTAERSDRDVERIVAQVRQRNRRAVLDLLERAQRAGDLPRRADLGLIADALLGTIYSRLRESNGRLDRRWLRALVRLVLAGATDSGPGRQAGTSGRNAIRSARD